MVAETLATTEAADATGGVQERLLVEFELAGERYGVDIADIREIIRYQAVTVIPGAPEIVEGIINLRGRVTPIVDLRKRLGLESAEVNDAMRIIVIEVDEALVGVHVDAVTGVIGLTSEQLQALSTEVTTERSTYLEGVADVDGRLVVLINLQNALDDGVAPSAPAPVGAPSEEAPDAPREEPAAAEVVEPEPAAGDVPVAEPPAIEEPVDLGLQVERLQRSFEALTPHRADVTTRFFAALADQHPDLQPVLGGVDDDARGALWSTLEGVVALIERSSELLPRLEGLGREFAVHGVLPAHYEAAGTALVETLGAVAGELWSAEDRDAWSDAVSLAAVVMIDAASAASTDEPEPSVAAPVTEADQPVAEPTPAKAPAAKRSSAGKTGTSAAATAKKRTRKPASTAAAQKPAGTSKGTRQAKTKPRSTKAAAAKSPAATKKPATKKAAVTKAAAKRPPAKKPAGRKPAATKRGAKAGAAS